jgi:redox-sensitive bicupin YhaK (pirin superfamily)
MNSVQISRPLSGVPLEIGDHFFAHSFHRRNLGDQMNPLLMVDHFWMKRDTFGWHPHRAISAVTYVFEDSRSAHHNYDTMGSDLPIRPGSLHWMVAGAGATHCERPEDPDARVHALQIFVDLPDPLKTVPPYAIHLESQDIPEVVSGRARVRVVAGEYQGVRSPAEVPQPFSFYDIFLKADAASIEIPLESGWGGWFYSVAGEMKLVAGGKVSNLSQNEAIGTRTGAANAVVTLTADQPGHVVVLAGRIVPSN